MEKSNPELEASLDALAKLCCDAISGDGDTEIERVDPLLMSLLMSGYNRSEERSLQQDLEERVKRSCSKQVSNRGGQLASMITDFSRRFAAINRQNSRTVGSETSTQSTEFDTTIDA
jgi:hypothetical protein